LTRNGRDFDWLASALQAERQVFCPDMAGRGKSDFFSDPVFYSYPQYVADMTTMLARVGVTPAGTGPSSVDWVGTSMGGIIGMLLAAEPNTPIRRLVINDIGPFIPLSALKRIADYVGMAIEFADLAQLERHMRAIYAPFGITKDEDWQHMAEHGARVLPNGKLTLAHDPAIARNFSALKEDVDLWAVYDRIQCPTLVLRGTLSDVLSAGVADEMTRRGPCARLAQFSGVGHAPALTDAEQIRIVRDFLHS
jgi:pimeloyl-ACP methyl ester carboxylesterase